MRSGLLAKIDREDRTWYLVMPMIGYLAEAGSGISLSLGAGQGCTTLALAIGLLLIVGIHNSWDITVWTVTRRSG
jgi:hypothetical protein